MTISLNYDCLVLFNAQLTSLAPPSLTPLPPPRPSALCSVLLAFARIRWPLGARHHFFSPCCC